MAPDKSSRKQEMKRPSKKTNSPPVPWIDPSNMDRSDLVVPFKPFDMHVERFPLQRLREIQQLPAFDTLPRILIPSSKLEIKPPVLHYAWITDRFESKLFQHAKDHNLPIMRSSKTHMKYDSDDEYCSDEDEEDSIGYYQLLQDTAVFVLKELNLSWAPDLIDITSSLNCRDSLILSVFTNYELARAPSPKSVEALRLWLEEPDQPKWYLDEMDYKWRPGYGRRW
ncbi:hypothetical protein SCP_0114920 [Sparassis crispa]|uniref:Uncharacterized protein n=1 Tax=Sparassis crispa TaxID=139825 RepID=A0A401G8Y6_9APHY|nr:hypothetical protein SCP_0114920 [Sparassis crispa]GBE78603.1 hypothetical protein SCP_0114920 [Sparassis crispa]